MGIAGLTTFINLNPTLFEPFRLHSTRVVLDGNNLLHILYYDYHVNHRYCGNYDEFARNIEHYFRAFFTCNVEPVVIFDGGYESDDRKLRTTLSRAQERIHLAGFISHGSGGKVLPVLAEVTFKNVLDQLNISHVTCDFEADDQLAALANHWQCPVVSNDSDFFVYNLVAGFIPLDHLTAEVSKGADGLKYFDTYIYRIQTFVKHFKCPDVEFVPLFATILGNDFVDGRKFENFFANIKLPRTKSKRFTVPKKQTRMAGLLCWLEDIDSIDDAVEHIVGFFKKEDREGFRKLIRRSISSYTDIESELKDYLENPNFEGSLSETRVKSYSGATLPTWFLNELHRGNLSVNLLNAVVLHRVIPLCQVENMEWDSAYRCACDIRKVTYGILLKHEALISIKNITETDEKITCDSCVEEYVRVKKKLTKELVEVSFLQPNGKTLPELESMPNLLIIERVSVISSALDVDLTSFLDLPSDLHLVFASTVYWLRHASPRVTKEHLLSILVCVLKLYCIDPTVKKLKESGCSNESGSCDEPNSMRRKILDNCSWEEIKGAKQKLEKVVNLPQHSNICAEVVHGFAQWHACVLSTIHLNQLLCRPVPEPQPSKIYNGNVVYAFCKELTQRRDPILFVSEMLGRRTVMAELFSLFINCCFSFVDENVFRTVHLSKKGSKRANQKKQSKGKGKSTVAVESGGAKSQNCAKKKTRSLIKAAVDVENKFSMLTLESDSN